MRVAVHAPSWLVFGAAYDPKWRATCDGRDLGEPKPMQGFANGWALDRGCDDLSFSYAYQRAATAGYLISGGGILALLVVALLGFLRGRRQGDEEPAPLALPPDGARARLALPRAAVLAILPALAVAFGFGLRAGAVAFVAFAVIAWRGIGDRALGLAAAALLGVGVPLTYILVSLVSDDEGVGGNTTDFGNNRIAAHWMALGALVALAVILWRTLRAQRPAGRGGAPQ
jgi:arabinofuranan 3-O-arabinosyltransferase